MAPFDPPLSKKGNKRCPKCGSGQSLYLFMNSRNPWATWECPNCGYRLGINARRYWLGSLLILASALVTVPSFLLLPKWGIPIGFLVFGSAAIIINWWLLSIEVKGKGLNKS